VVPVEGDFGYSASRESAECDTYRCHPDRVYVIVGNCFVARPDGRYGNDASCSVLAREADWLDVAEWMVDRGAQKIVIAVRRCLMSSVACRRSVFGRSRVGIP